MYKVGDMVVIPETKELKKIQEIERFKDDVVIYTTDGKAYGIRECKTVHHAYSHEINNLLNKWKV